MANKHRPPPMGWREWWAEGRKWPWVLLIIFLFVIYVPPPKADPAPCQPTTVVRNLPHPPGMNQETLTLE